MMRAAAALALIVALAPVAAYPQDGEDEEYPAPLKPGEQLVQPAHGLIFYAHPPLDEQSGVMVGGGASVGISAYAEVKLKVLPPSPRVRSGYIAVGFVGQPSDAEISLSSTRILLQTLDVEAYRRGKTCYGAKGVALVGPERVQYFDAFKLTCD